MSKKISIILSLSLVLLLTNCSDDTEQVNEDSNQVLEERNKRRIAVGKKIFFDTTLSTPTGQSCASCHDPKSGFADPSKTASSTGANTALKGDRNAPTSAYTAHIPEFRLDEKLNDYVGGQFLDGRAKTLAEQAKGSLLNPNEMANISKRAVVDKIENSVYIKDVYAIYGEDTFKDDTETAYDIIANLLASYEKSEEMNPFTSKYDYYLEGKVELSKDELNGLELFNGKGQCFICHNSVTPADGGHSRNTNKPLFSTYRYYNLGLPKNGKVADLGLGATLNNPAQNGKFKVPTLRNIELTSPYMHNGSLKTLVDVIDFYSTRESDKTRWGEPEIAETVTNEGIGDLQLTPKETFDIVSFLKTLTDGYIL